MAPEANTHGMLEIERTNETTLSFKVPNYD